MRAATTSRLATAKIRRATSIDRACGQVPPIVALALGSLAGALLWHHSATLPSTKVTWLVALAGGAGLLVAWRVTGSWRQILLFVAMAALLWATSAERSRPFFAHPLPESWFSTPQWLTLTVLTRVPLAGAPEAIVAEIDGPAGERWRVRLRVSPDQAKRWLPGERYRARVRLRPIVGSLQPGAFDSQWWAFRQQLAAQGRIDEASLFATGSLPFLLHLERWRAERAEALAQATSAHGEWLRALALGDRSSFAETTWRLVQQTGTAHLVSISGMHVTLVAWLIGALVRHIWQRFPRATGWRPASEVGWIIAALAGWAYVLVAGLGIPALRAALMLTVAAAAALTRVRLPLWGTLLAALWVVLLVDPWAVGEAGFWLSFAAVAILLGVSQTFERRAPVPSSAPGVALNWLQQTVAALAPYLTTQVAITLALIPLTLLFFGQAALVGSLANLLAIPLLAWLATPLALLLLIWPTPWLGRLFAQLIDKTLALLSWAAELPFAAITASPPQPVVLTVAAAALGAALLLPRGLAPRLAAIPALLLLFAPASSRPEQGTVRITLLDVGQGQTIHLQTARHDLLVDAGPATPEWDSGQRLVLPYLVARGVHRLDGVLITHFDRDHAGGLSALAAAIPIDHLWWGGPPHFDPTPHLPPTLIATPRTPCQAGATWVWDEIRFQLLWPPPGWSAGKEDNAYSCVLLVETPEGARFVVSGDLPRREEELVVKRATDLGPPRPTAIVAGHHGSKTSSAPAWVGFWQPEAVLFSVGAFNPFGHPDCAVVTRWEASGATLWRTDRDGALTVTLARQSVTVASARADHSRYWRQATPLPRCGRP